jgi:hypothetical protein
MRGERRPPRLADAGVAETGRGIAAAGPFGPQPDRVLEGPGQRLEPGGGCGPLVDPFVGERLRPLFGGGLKQDGAQQERQGSPTTIETLPAGVWSA